MDLNTDALAEATAQALWPRLSQRLDAQNELHRQLLERVMLLETTLVDMAQKLALYTPLLSELHEQVSDCRSELMAIAAERDQASHAQINAAAALATWRDLAERRQREIAALYKVKARYQAEIDRLRQELARCDG